MFKWLEQSYGKGKQKTRLLWGKVLNKKQKSKLLWEKEFNIVNKGLEEKQVVDFVNNLMAQRSTSQQASSPALDSLLKTAALHVQQMTTSIKAKAEGEAQTEAAAIINQAKQEAEEIKQRAQSAAERASEDIPSAAERKAGITQIETKQQALLSLLKVREEMEKEVTEDYRNAYSRLFSSLQNLESEIRNIETELKSNRAQLWESKKFELQEYEAELLRISGASALSLETSAPIEIEKEPEITSKEEMKEPAQLQEEAAEEEVEPVQLQEKAAVSETVKATAEELLEQHPPEERPEEVEARAELLKQDIQTLYTGEVELAIATPVDLKMVSKLYNHLQTIPEIRILNTGGSVDRGTIITVVLDKPVPLIGIISKILKIEVTPELSDKGGSVKEKLSSLLRTRKRKVKRIGLILKGIL